MISFADDSVVPPLRPIVPTGQDSANADRKRSMKNFHPSM